MSDKEMRRHQARAKAKAHSQTGAGTLKGVGRTKKMVTMAMMVAISVALVYLVHFPIMPMVPFLEYDPADIPILIGTFVFGPAAGLLLTFVTAIVQGVTVSAGSGFYGILMHIIATSALVLMAGTVYYSRKTRRTALIGLLAGMAVMALVMIPANMIITPAFMGVPTGTVWSLMPFIIAFNLIKAGINGIVTFYIYKRISNFLHSFLSR